MESIKYRLIEFISTLGISVSRFEQECGLSNGYIRNIKWNIGANKLESILKKYPQLSRSWVMTGVGDMLLPSGHSPVISGDGNTQVVGNSNTVNGGDVLAKSLAEMKELIRQQMESNSILVESNRMLVDSNKKLVDLLAEKCSS